MKPAIIVIILLIILNCIYLYNYISKRKLKHTKPKVYISLTTIPSRMDNIRPLVDSLLQQTLDIDGVILNIPHYSIRFKSDYSIPDYLQNYHPKLKINRCKDYGPGTKLLGALETIHFNKQDVIIIVDDDRMIDKNLSYNLYEEYKQHSESIISNFGNNQELNVKIPMGSAGMLIPLHTLDKQEIMSHFKKYEDYCRYVDDVFWYKYFVQHRNIPIHYVKSSTRINQAYNDTNALFREKGDLARYSNDNSIGLNKKCFLS